jgi:CubicO group peptidase (beta-lactamase class C family)
MKRIVAFLFLVICAEAQLAPEKIAAIEKIVTADMTKFGVPGMSIAVAIDNQLRWSNGYGMSDIENFVPAKASTIYRIGSISKPITATAAMQLVESGKLDLDAPVQRYVPAFPEKSWPVKVRHLLMNMSGIRHYKGDEFASTRHYTNLQDALSIFKDEPLEHAPEEKFTYTTYGFVLLGAAVENAAGAPYIDYVRERVFMPARMEHTRDDDHYAVIANRARGYRRTESGSLLNCGLADTSNKIPGGGFVSTAADMVRFALALQDGTLVKPESLKQMWTRSTRRDGQPMDYGLGWALLEKDGVIVAAGHGGGQQGITSTLQIHPQRRTAVSILTNLEGYRGITQLAEGILATIE